MTDIEELHADFTEALRYIDFSMYDPCSVDFIKALHIGLMHLLLKDVDSDHSSAASESQPEDTEEFDVSDEFNDAKKYLQKYIDTGDMMYKQMAQEELKHGNYLIRKEYSRIPDPAMKEKLKEWEETGKEIASQINRL